MAGADKEWLLQQLREVMADLPGQIAFTQPIEMRTSEMLTGARGDLAVKIFGPDLKKLAELAGQIKAALEKVSGAAEVITVSNATVDYLEVKADRLMAGRTGLSVGRIEDELRALLEGTPAGIVSEPGRRTNIIIRGTEDARNAPAQFALTQLAAGDGGLIRVSDIARLTRTAGSVKVDRKNASRFAIVQAEATVAERVRGRVRRNVMVLMLPRSRLPSLLETVRLKAGVPHLVYWVEPVESFGRLSGKLAFCPRPERDPDTVHYFLNAATILGCLDTR